MTACGCHDPIVFGHDFYCELDLGPTATGSWHPRRSDFRPELQCRPAEPEPPPKVPTKRTRLMQQTRELLMAYSRMKYAEYGIKPPD